MLYQKNSSSFLQGIIQRFLGRKESSYHEPGVTLLHAQTMMNLQEKHRREEMTQLEPKTLLRNGCTGEEIYAWTLLRDHYQHGGSDRGSVLRHLEFLKLLVQTGKIER